MLGAIPVATHTLSIQILTTALERNEVLERYTESAEIKMRVITWANPFLFLKNLNRDVWEEDKKIVKAKAEMT